MAETTNVIVSSILTYYYLMHKIELINEILFLTLLSKKPKIKEERVLKSYED